MFLGCGGRPAGAAGVAGGVTPGAAGAAGAGLLSPGPVIELEEEPPDGPLKVDPVGIVPIGLPTVGATGAAGVVPPNGLEDAAGLTPGVVGGVPPAGEPPGAAGAEGAPPDGEPP